jgi:allophanate hydrolase
VNARLGTYTTFANLLDLAVLAMPVGGNDPNATRPPAGVSLIGPAGTDDLLVAIGSRVSGEPQVSGHPGPDRPAIHRTS